MPHIFTVKNTPDWGCSFHLYLYLWPHCTGSSRSSRIFADPSLIPPKAQPLIHPLPLALPFHQSLTPQNIVLDCMADAIILGLYLHNRISHLHSWVLTGARQVKHHAQGDKNDWGPPGVQFRPATVVVCTEAISKCWWLFLHLANASISLFISSLPWLFPLSLIRFLISVYAPLFFNLSPLPPLYYLTLTPSLLFSVLCSPFISLPLFLPPSFQFTWLGTVGLAKRRDGRMQMDVRQ